MIEGDSRGAVLLHRSGAVWGERTQDALAQKGLLSIDGKPATPSTPLGAGSLVKVRDQDFVSEDTPRGRLQLGVPDAGGPAKKSSGPVRVHAGLHKCMTMFTRKVHRESLSRYRKLPWVRGPRNFRHFFHRADFFYADCTAPTVCSLSGRSLDLDRFDDVRVLRLIRNPRDLPVSG